VIPLQDTKMSEEEHGHASLGLGPKVATMVATGIVTLAASLLPFVATSFMSRKQAIVLVRLFAGLSAGIILGLLLIHVLPEASGYFQSYFSMRFGEDGDPHDHGSVQAYPWPMVLCGATFIILLTLEQAFSFHTFHSLQSPQCDSAEGAPAVDGAPSTNRGNAADHSRGHGHGHSHGHVCDHVAAPLEALAAHSTTIDIDSKCSSSTSGQAGNAASSNPTCHSTTLVAPDSEGQPATVTVACGNVHDVATTTTTTTSIDSNGTSWSSRVAGALGFGSASKQTNEVMSKVATDIAESTTGSFTASQMAARAWVFALAMSVHGLLDGFGLGIDTNEDGFAALAVAIVAHKALDGLALGSAVVSSELPLW
jgi:zinc transporter ZupT